MTSGFTFDSATTAGVTDSYVVYEAHLWKLGAAAAHTTNVLPINLGKARYEVEVEIVSSTNNCIKWLYFIQRVCSLHFTRYNDRLCATRGKFKCIISRYIPAKINVIF